MSQQLGKTFSIQMAVPVRHLFTGSALDDVETGSVAVLQSFSNVSPNRIILFRIGQLPDQQHIHYRLLTLFVINAFRASGLGAFAGFRVNIVDNERCDTVGFRIHHVDWIKHATPRCQEGFHWC